ncbi:hypothetical protein OAT67_10030 [Bacteriovoracaceae bacterium]|nr:hypothetical protein [Bacteriovoracaceae bacterium]|tara:strand:- start:8233 stop:8766 length:534 start_codon:yes stop_codon:yes gene_type:complete
MKPEIKGNATSFFVTLLILFVLEIISTALLPLLGVESIRIPFNILIILFLGFKVNSPALALMILGTQYFHSFFSIEGWEMGTVAGILICILIGYLKDLLHFSSAGFTIIVTQIFQTVWFIIISGLFYLKFGSFDYVIEKFWRFLPESIIISILSPFFFSVLDKIWNVGEGGMLGDET